VIDGVGYDSVRAIDLNLDGFDELVYVFRNLDSVGVAISDGEGGFVKTPLFLSGGDPRFAAIADFDEDGTPDLASSNSAGASVSIFLNRMEERVDPNASNRVDGFDVAEIGRRTPAGVGEPGYRRTHDVDLNGVIDGDDLAIVGERFGGLVKVPSQFRPTVEQTPPSTSGTVTLQEADEPESVGDLLILDVVVNAAGQAASAAEFVVTSEPAAVLQAVGFDPGEPVFGGIQAFDFDPSTPGRTKVTIQGLSGEDNLLTGTKSLLSLYFRCRAEGTATLNFAAVEGRATPTLLDASNNPVGGVDFVGGGQVSVDATQEAALGQKIGFSPALLDFGAVPAGAPTKKSLRLANFGFADLQVTDVTSTISAFTSFFTSRFTIPPYGSMDLPVQFSPTTPGVFAGELIVSSDDPERPAVWARVLGRSEPGITVNPSFVEFGTVFVGGSATRRIGIGNRGNAPLRLSNVTVSHPEFLVRTEFVLLDPGEFGGVEVEFKPTSPGDLHGSLTLDFDAPATKTVALSLVGSAQAGP
jgi:hypothetical protein